MRTKQSCDKDQSLDLKKKKKMQLNNPGPRTETVSLQGYMSRT